MLQTIGVTVGTNVFFDWRYYCVLANNNTDRSIKKEKSQSHRAHNRDRKWKDDFWRAPKMTEKVFVHKKDPCELEAM